MATIYNAQLTIVSDFCKYSEEEIINIINTALDGYFDKRNGLKLRVPEIEVKEEKYDKPIEPLAQIIQEGALHTCNLCHSTIKTKWFGLIKLGCIQPKCKNYYLKKTQKENTKSDKVYCNDCKYGALYGCYHPSNIYYKDTPKEILKYYIREMVEINKDNDCGNYVQRR